MNRLVIKWTMTSVLVLSFLLSSGWGHLAEARQENIVKIVSPNPGERVGARVVVKGTSKIHDKSKIWVLVHLKLLRNQWWPQPEPTVDENGNWEALAYIGEPQDIGMDFEIAVATFDPHAEAGILRYHDHGNKTGQWLPIKFPKTTSDIDIVVVRKKDHN
jgi:hypothetical protein